jgi:prepilin-type processing-associated H-X9-DG protein
MSEVAEEPGMSESGGCGRRFRCACATFIVVLAVVLGGLYWWTGRTPMDVWAYFDNPKEKANVRGCLDNLNHINTALGLYLESNDAYPPASVWMDKTIQYGVQGNMEVHEAWKFFRCPSVSKGEDEKYGYAMNRALSGKLRPLEKNKKEWATAKETMVVFDSSDLRKNVNGGRELLPKPARHTGKNNALYGDGHVAPAR